MAHAAVELVTGGGLVCAAARNLLGSPSHSVPPIGQLRCAVLPSQVWRDLCPLLHKPAAISHKARLPEVPHCLLPFFITFFSQRFFQVSGTGMAPVPSFLSCCTFSRIAVLIWLCQQGSGQEGITSLYSCCHGDSKKDSSLQSLSPSTARVDAGQVPASGEVLLSVLTY